MQGFVSAVQNLRDFVPVVYDMTVAISKEAPNPTILRILKCQSSVVNIIINLKYNGPWV
jgi:lysophosphatidic acid acyltransferase/lysophosphatidylinositol acyltransferase